MKKYKKDDPEFVNMLINKALEKYGETVETIRAKQKQIKKDTGLEWYQYYTFDTKEEYDSWKQFCIDSMMTMITPKMSKTAAEAAFLWLDLDIGLTQKYLHIDENKHD